MLLYEVASITTNHYFLYMSSVYYSAANSYSKSLNAHRAEFAGRYPATHAAKKYGFKSTKALKDCVESTEWHHVGKFATRVDYYDIESWIAEQTDLLELIGISKKLTKEGRKTTLKDAVAAVVNNNFSDKIDYVKRAEITLKKFTRIDKFRKELDVISYKLFVAPTHLTDDNLKLAVIDANLKARDIKFQQKKQSYHKKVQAQLNCIYYKTPKQLKRIKELEKKYPHGDNAFVGKVIKLLGWSLPDQAWVEVTQLIDFLKSQNKHGWLYDHTARSVFTQILSKKIKLNKKLSVVSQWNQYD